jgi:branched-subunit amino acid ABC-type transport system permease component
MFEKIMQGQQTRVGGVILPNSTGLIVTIFMLMLVLLFAHLAYSKRGSILRFVLPTLSRIIR